MTRIEKLAAELTADPLALGYSAMTDEEVVTAMNAENRSRYVPLDSSALSEWAMGGPMMKIKRALDADTLGDAVMSIVYGAWRMLDRENAIFNAADARHIGMVDVLVSAGVLSGDDKTALLSMASESISRATEIGVHRLRVGTVEDARRKIA